MSIGTPTSGDELLPDEVLTDPVRTGRERPSAPTEAIDAVMILRLL